MRVSSTLLSVSERLLFITVATCCVPFCSAATRPSISSVDFWVRWARPRTSSATTAVNQDCLTGDELLVSNASCTTNCSVPLLRLLDQAIGLEHVSITTIHSAMNDQPVIDRSEERRTPTMLKTCGVRVRPFSRSFRCRPAWPEVSNACCRNLPGESRPKRYGCRL